MTDPRPTIDIGRLSLTLPPELAPHATTIARQIGERLAERACRGPAIPRTFDELRIGPVEVPPGLGPGAVAGRIADRLWAGIEPDGPPTASDAARACGSDGPEVVP